VKELRDSGERVRGDEGILGGYEFVDRVLRESQEEWERREEFRKRGLDLKWLVEKVACHFGVDSVSLRAGSKVSNAAEARAILCYVGVRWMGLTAASIAKDIGISPSAVRRVISRAPKAMQGHDIEGQLLECQ
jgi:chromosomal replication initiation ATPase DnaA